MSSATPVFFYGVPLVNAMGERSKVIQMLVDDQPDGVYTYYCGKGRFSQIAGFGIPLSTMRETDHHTEADRLTTTPTAVMIGEYHRLLKALEPEHRAAVEECGTPRTVVLWASS